MDMRGFPRQALDRWKVGRRGLPVAEGDKPNAVAFMNHLMADGATAGIRRQGQVSGHRSVSISETVAVFDPRSVIVINPRNVIQYALMHTEL